MPLNAYLKLKGKKQGDIRGSVTQKGREGAILVHSFDHEIEAPFDPTTGKANGKRQHTPIVLLKEIDQTSPLLMKALVGGEAFDLWELQLWAPAATPTGQDKLVYTISLTNARLASIQTSAQSTPLMAASTAAPADTPSGTPSSGEDVATTYDDITWTWTDGGVTATDSW